MIRKLNVNDDKELRSLLELQRLSYQVEAELIGYADLPPLKDNLDTLRSSNEHFYGYFIAETLVGAISYELKRISGVRPGKGLDICRLVVHPEFFRRGIGGNLLRKIEELEDPELITVATGTMNKPAKELYRRLGFVAQEELEVALGILITCFQKVSKNKKL